MSIVSALCVREERAPWHLERSIGFPLICLLLLSTTWMPTDAGSWSLHLFIFGSNLLRLVESPTVLRHSAFDHPTPASDAPPKISCITLSSRILRRSACSMVKVETAYSNKHAAALEIAPPWHWTRPKNQIAGMRKQHGSGPLLLFVFEAPQTPAPPNASLLVRLPNNGRNWKPFVQVSVIFLCLKDQQRIAKGHKNTGTPVDKPKQLQWARCPAPGETSFHPKRPRARVP